MSKPPHNGNERYAPPAILKPTERLIDALTDPTRRERTALIVLAAYAVIWTLYGVLAKASQDMQFDTAELVALSRELVLGYRQASADGRLAGERLVQPVSDPGLDATICWP